MIHEFAIDPAVMGNWNSHQILWGDFGYDKGRLITQFPKKWRKEVYAQARKQCTEIQAKRITERISKRSDNFLIKTERPYTDPEASWEENARSSQQDRAFRGIVLQTSTTESSHFIDINSMNKEREPYHVPVQSGVPRNKIDLIKAGEMLYKNSREFLIVDPYFRPDTGGNLEERFTATFHRLLDFLKESGVKPFKIEIHTVPKIVRDADFCDFDTERDRAAWEREISDKRRDDIPFKIVYRKENVTGGTPHQRCILTDKGGIAYENGLDEGDGETDVTLIQEQRWKELLSIYRSTGTSDQIKTLEIR